MALRGHRRVGAVEAPREHGTPDTGRPLSVPGRIELRRDGPPIVDNRRALPVADGPGKRRQIAIVHVGMVGQPHHQRGDGAAVRGKVGRVAPEKGRARVEAQVAHGVLVGHGGEGQRPGEICLLRALVARHERGAVGPAVLCIRRGVVRKNHVDGAVRVEVRMEGYVLRVLAAVDEVQRHAVGVAVRRRVEAAKGVGRPLGDVVGRVRQRRNELGGSGNGKVGHVAGNVLFVVVLEQGNGLGVDGRGGAHDEAGIVESRHAAVVVGDVAIVKDGADVAERHPACEHGVGRAELPGGKLVDGRVGGGYGVPGVCPAVGEQKGHGRLACGKGRVVGDGAPGVARSAIGDVDHLVGKHSPKVVGGGDVKVGACFALYIIKDLGVVATDTILVRACDAC